jgi:hypothetical protein
VQASTPDVASVPANATGTARLYQPPASGPRAACPPVTAGAVASYLIVSESVPLTLPALSVQVPVTETAAASGPG